MERKQFDGITPEDKDLCYGLFGINDKTVNPVNSYATFTKHYNHAERIEAEHQLNEKVLRKYILPLIKDLLGEKYEDATHEPLPDYMKY